MGNSSNCSATVTVQDTVRPVVACSDITVYLNSLGTGTITSADVGSSTDACGIASDVVDVSSFTCATVGANTVTFTATDTNANSSACTATVTVVDSVAPVVSCTNITVQLDPAGSYTLLPGDIGTAVDSCGIAMEALDLTVLGCAEVGSNTLTYTATDVNGNATACSATVMVMDTVVPVVICTDITVDLDATGNTSITVPDIAFSADSCGISTEVLDITGFTCNEIGSNTVTFIATDINGNVNSCTATLWVQDTVAPMVSCVDLTVYLDSTGNTSIIPANLGMSNDSCGIASEGLDTLNFDCGVVGANTVTYTATDVNGNAASCSAMVTVRDTIPPVVTCTDLTVHLDSTGMTGIVAGDVGASTDVCGIATGSLDILNFACADLGANIVTFTATGVDGNISTCTATVTVEDTLFPEALCQSHSIQLDSIGWSRLEITDIDKGSNDNCGIDSMWVSQDSFSCAGTGTHPVVLTVVDTSGNLDSCVAMVTVEDTSGNTFRSISLGPDTSLCFTDSTLLDAGTNFITYRWYDTDSTVIDSMQTYWVTGAGGYSVEVWDTFGCYGNGSIQIFETPPPDSFLTVIAMMYCVWRIRLPWFLSLGS